MEGPTPALSRRLHRFAVGTAGMTLLLLVAGALVTSNDAGLAVPDWPLSYGTWMPPLVGGILYEHSHRMIATWVGLLTTALAVWLLIGERRRWVRRLGLVALAAVSAQGILGGLTVLHLLPWPVSTAHATLAQLFFSLTVVLAWVTGAGWQLPAPALRASECPGLRGLALAAPILILLQLALGAALRHQAIGIGPHLGGALGVVGVVALLARRLGRFQGQATWCGLRTRLLTLLGVQLILGASAYLVLRSAAAAPQPQPLAVAITVAHVVAGALLLATSVLLALEVWRRTSPGRTTREPGLQVQEVLP